MCSVITVLLEGEVELIEQKPYMYSEFFFWIIYFSLSEMSIFSSEQVGSFHLSLDFYLCLVCSSGKELDVLF